jgi:predicted DNA-binding antitoxin AbrB/MazE fold protein
MAHQIEATYEGGVLKPDAPLPLKDHERVVVTVRPKTSRIRQSAGLLQWTGDRETLRKIAEDPISDDSDSP